MMSIDEISKKLAMKYFESKVYVPTNFEKDVSEQVKEQLERDLTNIGIEIDCVDCVYNHEKSTVGVTVKYKESEVANKIFGHP